MVEKSIGAFRLGGNFIRSEFFITGTILWIAGDKSRADDDDKRQICFFH
jgi:hypothetical protein